MVPDSAHIIPEGREERMRRAFAFSTLEEVSACVVKLTDVMLGLADVIGGAGRGEIRDLWVHNIRYIIDEITKVAELLHSIAESKLN
jgi:hypothetical protein